jgi:hypothetical protein
MELLRGLGDEMRGELLAMGVEIDPLSKALLGQYLQSAHPETAGAVRPASRLVRRLLRAAR